VTARRATRRRARDVPVCLLVFHGEPLQLLPPAPSTVSCRLRAALTQPLAHEDSRRVLETVWVLAHGATWAMAGSDGLSFAASSRSLCAHGRGFVSTTKAS